MPHFSDDSASGAVCSISLRNASSISRRFAGCFLKKPSICHAILSRSHPGPCRHEPMTPNLTGSLQRDHATPDAPSTGEPNQQNPMDAWVVQEILFKSQPDFIVECGSFHGESAAMWAMILQQVSPAGRVISIDIEDRMGEARKLPIVKEKSTSSSAVPRRPKSSLT
jgi:hypothetical protein